MLIAEVSRGLEVNSNAFTGGAGDPLDGWTKYYALELRHNNVRLAKAAEPTTAPRFGLLATT
jgi:hypothetical protein